MSLIRKIVASAFLLTILSGCVSSQSLNREAEQNYTQVKLQASSQGAIDNSSNTSERIHKVFNRMKPYAEKANNTGVPFNWEITVLKSDEMNAWAMPGGKMAFYTGLVDNLNLSDDEIAAVMGHEMSHALLEHGKSSRAFDIITNVATQMSNVSLTSQGGMMGGFGTLFKGMDLMISKPFSRSQETEADELGLMLMARAGYNPSTAPNVWVKMSKATGSSEGSIFSTHPSNADRQENLTRLLPEAMKVYQASRK